MSIQLLGSGKGEKRSPWNVSLENYLLDILEILEILEMVRRDLREVESPSRICNPVQWWPTAQEMSLWDITEKAGWNWNYWSISTASCLVTTGTEKLWRRILSSELFDATCARESPEFESCSNYRFKDSGSSMLEFPTTVFFQFSGSWKVVQHSFPHFQKTKNWHFMAHIFQCF